LRTLFAFADGKMSGRTGFTVRPLFVYLPRPGKKGVWEEGRRGRRKNLAGGENLSYLPTRSSTGAVKRQAERVGSIFILCCESAGETEKKQKTIFCLLLLFLSDGDII
jgi:hypothetical protein